LKTELSLSDEWETPKDLYDYLCTVHGFYPYCDVCATWENKKCGNWFDKEKNGLERAWIYERHWCNPPHSNTEEWVKKACFEFIDRGAETMMIIPANSMCTNYAEYCIIPHAEHHPINRKFCKFLQDGEEKDSSRNGYFVVIWRKI